MRDVEAARRAARPTRRVAVLACMDARVDPVMIFGFSPGEAHVLRNAGGVVTDDVVRSLAMSQRLLGTEEVLVLHHTGCGMDGLDVEALADDLEASAGVRPDFLEPGFDDVTASVRATVARLEASPYLTQRLVRGFVYDVDRHELTPVPSP